MATKAQREKAERLLLKEMIERNPKLKAFLDASINNENPELVDVLKPVMQDHLEKARKQGIDIGFMAAYLGMYTKAKNCSTLDEVIDMLKHEADTIRAKLGLNTVDDMEAEIEDNGN